MARKILFYSTVRLTSSMWPISLVYLHLFTHSRPILQSSVSRSGRGFQSKTPSEAEEPMKGRLSWAKKISPNWCATIDPNTIVSQGHYRLNTPFSPGSNKVIYTLSEAWGGVNWPDLMAAQGYFGTDFCDRSILRRKHRAYYRSGRPVIKIGPKGALGSHENRPIHSASSLGQSI